MAPNSLQSTQASAFQKKYGPWAVVTGASDGIGREIARSLAGRGVSLVLVARRETALRRLADELAYEFGIDTLVLAADLGSAEQNWKLFASTEPLDVGLFVAAAGFGTSGDLIDADPSVEAEMIDVNCRAVLLQTHHFARRFARKGRGGIVLFSSLVAFQGVARAANYAATKAYIQSLAEALRIELRPAGVDVVASAPGPVESGFAARAKMMLSGAEKPRTVAEETLTRLGRAATVRPGLKAKLLEASLAFLPRSGRVRIMSMVMKGMTGHRHDILKKETA